MLGFLDIIIVAVLATLYAGLGFYRGILRSITSVAVLYGSYMAAKIGAPVVFPIVVGIIPIFGAYMYIAIFAIIMYLTYLLLGMITGMMFKRVLNFSRPRWLSRFFGGLIGAVMGVFLASILFYLLQIFAPMGTPFVSSILNSPVANALIGSVGRLL